MFFYCLEHNSHLPDFEMLPDVLDLPNVAQDLTFLASSHGESSLNLVVERSLMVAVSGINFLGFLRFPAIFS